MNTQHPHRSSLRSSFAALLLSATFLPSPSQAVVITESFDTPLGGIPNGWTVVTRGNVSNDGIVEIANISESLGNALRLYRPSSGGQGSFSSGVLYYTGSEFPAAEIEDFSAEVTFRLGAVLGDGSTVGIMVRTQSLSYSFGLTPFGVRWRGQTEPGRSLVF